MTSYPEHLSGFDYVGVHRYFLTFCTFERRRHFNKADHVELVRTHFAQQSAHEHFEIPAYCFMPDHVHLLVEGRASPARRRGHLGRSAVHCHQPDPIGPREQSARVPLLGISHSFTRGVVGRRTAGHRKASPTVSLVRGRLQAAPTAFRDVGRHHDQQDRHRTFFEPGSVPAISQRGHELDSDDDGEAGKENLQKTVSALMGMRAGPWARSGRGSVPGAIVPAIVRPVDEIGEGRRSPVPVSEHPLVSTSTDGAKFSRAADRSGRLKAAPTYDPIRAKAL